MKKIVVIALIVVSLVTVGCSSEPAKKTGTTAPVSTK